MSVKELNYEISGKNLNFAVVGACWNSIFTDALIKGAIDTLVKHGVASVDVLKVPGSFEIPVACQELAETNKYHGIVAVGTLIKGETDHYDMITSQVTAGIANLMLKHKLPITLGVIAVHNQEQAMARSGSKAGNKGSEAAMAALELACAFKMLRSSSRNA